MGKFAKGQSGNPGGRPKDTARIGEIARQHSEAAIGKLAQLMNHKDPHVAIKASCALLDRGHGKPAQSTEITGKDGKHFALQVITGVPRPSDRGK